MRRLAAWGMVAAALCAAAPAHAGWFNRKPRVAAEAPAYDPTAIDQLLYPIPPAYDYGALDVLLRSAEEQAVEDDKTRWRLVSSGYRGRRTPPFGQTQDFDQTSSLVSLFGTATLNESYDLDIVPYARFSNGGGYREAGGGGMLRLSLFQTHDGRRLGGKGRWFLYGAAGGRAVGWNFAHTEDGAMRALGLSTDRTSGVIAEAEAGVAWRKGGAQASLGYVRRKVRLRGGLSDLDLVADLDLFPHSDDALAFTFSYVPQQ